jgi:hypothetical protein
MAAERNKKVRSLCSTGGIYKSKWKITKEICLPARRKQWNFILPSIERVRSSINTFSPIPFFKSNIHRARREFVLNSTKDKVIASAAVIMPSQNKSTQDRLEGTKFRFLIKKNEGISM